MILSLVLTLYLVFRTSGVQTFLARLAAHYLSQEWKTEVRISGFDLSISHGLIIEGIRVMDQHNDTLFSADGLGLAPDLFHSSSSLIKISRVYIERGNFQLLTHRGDSTLNLQFIINYFAGTDTTSTTDTSRSGPLVIKVASVIMEDTRFHFQDENEPDIPYGMNYANIDVSGIDLDINGIEIEGDTIRAEINHLAALERSGFTVHAFSGKFQVSPAFLKAHDLRIITPHSDLDLSFEFLYDGWNGYVDFLEKVTINARIAPSVFDLTDIGYFAPDIKQMQNRFRISGDIAGTVGNFKATGFRFSFGRNTSFEGDISVFGLPDVYRTFMDLNIRRMVSNRQDIEAFMIPVDPPNLSLSPIFDRPGNVSIQGVFTGYYDRFATNLLVRSCIGNAHAELLVTRDSLSKRIGYTGRLGATDLDVGGITGIPEYFGKASFKASLVGSGLSLEDADLSLNLKVDSIEAYHYGYRNLNINGSLAGKQFDGNMAFLDPNLMLDFHGIIDLRDTIPDFDFKANIHHADLNRLHLLDRDSINLLTAVLDVNCKGDRLDNLDGYIRLDSTRYIEAEKEITMDHFLLTTLRGDTGEKKSYNLTSDFADATVSGDFLFTDMVNSLTIFIRNYLATFRLQDSLTVEHPVTDQMMSYRIRLKETREVTGMFLPFLTIANGTTLEGEYNEKKPSLTLRCRSPLLSIYGTDLDEWYFDAETLKDDLALTIGCETLFFKRSTKDDSVEIRLDTFQLISHLHHDTLTFDLSWIASQILNSLNGYASFTGFPQIDTRILDFDLSLDRRRWSIDPANRVNIDTTSIQFSNVNFYSGTQHLKVNGKISADPADTLVVDINEVDVSRVDALLGGYIDVDGELGGIVRLSNIYNNITFTSDMQLNRFQFNKELLGDATLSVGYNSGKSRFDIRAEILYTGNKGQNIPLALNGTIQMNDLYPELDFDLGLKNLNLRMFSPFVSDFMSGLNGLVSGDIRIRGTAEKPLVTGKLNMKRTEFKISYLNVGYSLADAVTIDSNAIRFSDITLYDSLGHKAKLNGAITHRNFKDFRLDLKVNLDDFSAFNNNRAQNNIFYGKARGTGNVAVSGPFDNILIDVKAKTGGNTHVTIPISLTESVGDNDFIVFEEKKGDSLIVVRNKSASGGTDISLNLALQVTPDAEVEVFFPDQLGNLKATGTGTLLMTMTPKTPFLMKGTYTLAKGSFVFTLRNLLRLPMAIRTGSSISWTGDPADADVNLAAAYKTKVPLTGLTSDPEIAGLRINVECILRLSGKLLNPDIRFSLNTPNVEESIRSLVYSAIDTTNVSEMNQQMFYLLIANQFKPIVSGTGSSFDVGSTSVSLLTNQINSWLSGISKNVNVGVNYRPASGMAQQEFDVNFSTQFFNDRLLIDGTFGMNSYNNANIQQASTVVGDINIEYLLTKNRRWRVHAFNRTNTLSLLNNNSPYTQGVGLTYTRNFSALRELFTRSAKEKKKKTP